MHENRDRGQYLLYLIVLVLVPVPAPVLDAASVIASYAETATGII